jgi:hypothetical protein
MEIPPVSLNLFGKRGENFIEVGLTLELRGYILESNAVHLLKHYDDSL